MKLTCLPLLLLLFINCALRANNKNLLAGPTVPSSNLSFSNIQGNAMTMVWTKGDGQRRIVIAKAGSAVTAVPSNGNDYNSNLIFGNGAEIAPDEFVVYDNSGSSTLVFGLQPNTVYHFAIFEYNGTGAGTEYLTASFAAGSQSTSTPPGTQASALVFSNVEGGSVTLSWTNGDGASRLVLCKEGAAVNANPVNLTNYSGNAFFGSGSQVGTGNFAVYKGNGSSVAVTNLEPNTTYHFAVFEYNGISAPVYLSPGATASQLTGTSPTTAATNWQTSNQDGNRFRYSFTKGNGTRRIVIAKEGSAVTATPVDGQSYSANVTFGNGAEIAPGEFVISSNTSSNQLMYGLNPNTTYHLAVFEYNGTGNNTYYQTVPPLTGTGSTLSAPTVQGSNLQFSGITGSSIQISWTNGNGSKRLVVARADGNAQSPPVDLANYSPSASFGNGSNLGNSNYVIYESTGTSMTLVNLSPNTTYHFDLYEFNGSVGPVYLRPAASASQATVGAPTVAASNLGFGSIEGNRMFTAFTKGNGARRIIIAKAGSAVTAVPVDGTDYVHDFTFGNGDEIAPGEFVVYDGAANSVSINGLSPNTVYHLKIVEYNGTGSSTLYLVNPFLSGQQSTATTPTAAPSNISFSNVEGNSMTISWTNGNGAGRMVIAKAGSAVDGFPVDLQTYSPSLVFGSGSEIGTGNRVLYSGTLSSITVLGLSLGETYHFAVIEYNGSNAPVYQTPGTAAQQMASSLPSVQASNGNVNLTGAYRLNLTWTKGNGNRRVVLAKQGSAVDAVPANGTSYNPDGQFGNGDEIGTGNFVVYDGTGSSQLVTGLAIGTDYHFSIFEYGGSGANINYLSPGHAFNHSTATIPTTAPSNFSAFNVNGTSAQAGWTNGNGNGRLVVISDGNALTQQPVHGTAYNAAASGYNDPVYALGNGYRVYKGQASSALMTNLTGGTTYHVFVFEYNGNDNYPAFNTAALAGQFTTLGEPQTPATSLSATDNENGSASLNWTRGSGQQCLVLAKEGSAVDAAPQDGQDYTAQSFFGSGDEIGTGNFVVYEGPASNLTLSNLAAGQTYHLAVYEFNFTGANTDYLAADPARAQVSTLLPVEMASFTASKNKGGGILLKWETASETNSGYFEIQHSNDGRIFVPVQKVPSAGNSFESHQYRFLHNPPEEQNYYRLKQVDIDGLFSFSKTIYISLENKHPEAVVFPNPTNGFFEIKNVDEPAACFLINILGERVVEFRSDEKIWAGHLAAGLYWMVMEKGNGEWEKMPLHIGGH